MFGKFCMVAWNIWSWVMAVMPICAFEAGRVKLYVAPMGVAAEGKETRKRPKTSPNAGRGGGCGPRGWSGGVGACSGGGGGCDCAMTGVRPASNAETMC